VNLREKQVMPAYVEPTNNIALLLYFTRTQAAVTLLAILVLLAGALNAEATPCNGATKSFGFYGLPEKQVTIYVKKNTPCNITFGRVPFAFFNQTVTKRPRGIYGIANTISGAYQPPGGYVGDDYFELLLQYQKLGVGQERFRTTLKVTATITE
jgi:hypothetical protein